MQDFNFDEINERRNTGSLKWDVKEGELPMWVADMDFKTAPAVREAVMKKAGEGIFGYHIIPDEWYDAYINWWDKRHSLKLKKEGLIFTTGVIPAISSIVRKLTTPAEKVLVQTPVYNIFFNSIFNNGRYIVKNPLKLTEAGYEMNFEDLEEKLKDPQLTLMLLCNPQNPSGRIWDKETLARTGELCKKYGVTVVSDEIHCDICEAGYSYTPFASVSETNRNISISCFSASKAFNVAGLNSAAVYIEDPFIRHKVWRGLNTDEVAEPGAFAICSTVAAFNEGGEWLDAMNAYIAENRKIAAEAINNIKGLKLMDSHATYLLWIDAREAEDGGIGLADKIRERTGLYISDGEEYGTPGFLRMNIACPKSMLEDGLKRLKEALC
ncbi:MAG: pyridoxal phosphate-dependent aminotransferase [Lachnospiraceae bacterium]|nr:pyridoxal phosphate-dependent aminotransferase [Lachnospiraceae bacterium]